MKAFETVSQVHYFKLFINIKLLWTLSFMSKELIADMKAILFKLQNDPTIDYQAVKCTLLDCLVNK